MCGARLSPSSFPVCQRCTVLRSLTPLTSCHVPPSSSSSPPDPSCRLAMVVGKDLRCQRYFPCLAAAINTGRRKAPRPKLRLQPLLLSQDPSPPLLCPVALLRCFARGREHRALRRGPAPPCRGCHHAEDLPEPSTGCRCSLPLCSALFFSPFPSPCIPLPCSPRRSSPTDRAPNLTSASHRYPTVSLFPTMPCFPLHLALLHRP